MSSASPGSTTTVTRTKIPYLTAKTRPDEVADFAFILMLVSLGLAIAMVVLDHNPAIGVFRAHVVFYNLALAWAGFAFAALWTPLLAKPLPLLGGLLVAVLAVVASILSNLQQGVDYYVAGLVLTGCLHAALFALVFSGLRKTGQRLWLPSAVFAGVLLGVGAALHFWLGAYYLSIVSDLASIAQTPDATLVVNDAFYGLRDAVALWPAIVAVVVLIFGFSPALFGIKLVITDDTAVAGAKDISGPLLPPEYETQKTAPTHEEQMRFERLRALRLENDLKEIELAEKRSKESGSPAAAKSAKSDSPKGKMSR